MLLEFCRDFCNIVHLWYYFNRPTQLLNSWNFYMIYIEICNPNLEYSRALDEKWNFGEFLISGMYCRIFCSLCSTSYFEFAFGILVKSQKIMKSWKLSALYIYVYFMSGNLHIKAMRIPLGFSNFVCYVWLIYSFSISFTFVFLRKIRFTFLFLATWGLFSCVFPARLQVENCCMGFLAHMTFLWRWSWSITAWNLFSEGQSFLSYFSWLTCKIFQNDFVYRLCWSGCWKRKFLS